MSIGSGVVIAVAFQEVDCALNGETGTEGDYEGLENVYRAIEEIHNIVAGERKRLCRRPLEHVLRHSFQKLLVDF